MKPRFANQRNRAFTVFEALVVAILIGLLAVLLLPILVPFHGTNQHVNCVSNLKQVNLSLRIWEGDNNNEYPMGVSVTNGGGMEFILAGNVAGCLQVVSNEMSTTRILICPADWDHTYATNFGNDFNNSHISYFFNPDVTNNNDDKMILDGDDNFAIGGVPVKSGLLELSSNAPISWTAARHKFVGNLGFADGSVQEVNSILELQIAFEQTGVATNRLAIP